MTFQKFPALIAIVTLTFMSSGCDTVTDLIKNFSSSQESSEKNKEVETSSYEKTLLVDILLKQKSLIEEMLYASEYGDRQSIKESYEEFLRLDQDYQQEFARYEEALSNREGWKISKMHQQIVKGLLTYSSLMSR